MPFIIEILPESYKFERSTQICMRATPTVQNRVSLACASSALPKPNTLLCAEMILLVEIQI